MRWWDGDLVSPHELTLKVRNAFAVRYHREYTSFEWRSTDASTIPTLVAYQPFRIKLLQTGPIPPQTTFQTSGAIAVDPPTVSSVEITSDPGPDNTYAADEDLELTATFSEPVNVTGSPQLALQLGGQPETATYDRGSGTNKLVFAHTVEAGDQSNTIFVPHNAITLNGGTINSVAHDFAANLSHNGFALANSHIIDGVSPALNSGGVDGATLTASFSGVPGEHAGEGTFTFDLTFSEDVKGLSFRTLRDEAFDVSGGAVRRAKRKQSGSNLGWTIHVEPASHGAVTIRLPAGSVEAADGRALSNSPSATIPGPAAALDFAHFANGTGITSEMVFLNPSTQPSRPAVYFYDTEGDPIAADSVVDLTGDLEVTEDGALTVWTQMEPLGELTISTHGRGELVTGSVRVVSDGPIGGLLRFDLPGVGAGVVGASPPLSDALFPVRRQEEGINTFAAIHNLESSPEIVRCELMREGVLRDAVSIPLAANGQSSWFIDQAFPAADTSDFAGSVHCDAEGPGMFTAVALEPDPGNRIFITLPVVPVPERASQE